jgi:hypothetical protein
MSQDPRTFWNRAFLYLCCYLAWLALSALGAWVLLALRLNIIDLAAVFRLNPWAFPALHNFSMVFLGLGWLGFVIVLEEYLRRGIEKGDLWLRAARALNVLLIVLILSYALQRMVGV